ncbi:MAG: type II toxin-antitoxin system PemK/MazF family toxin [Marvinbryantia sp.]|uniref:type II toxin-antitoxin system PemK/MazF family toxin n=1 Tax=Marvinbryantia sp. TaxID=2496532 RepID=UPI0025CBEC4E|nr:type II toxin-antitoxin system PemK/MazF family toxin [uncultured Marvinbryantia sp.]
MNQEAQEYYNIAGWVKDKINYNRISKFNSNKRRQVLYGQIWYCDLGYNIGTEKNKMRPVLVMSNNRINNSEKVVVVCITDAKGKTNANNLPAQDSWFLLYSDTEDDDKMICPGRQVPASMHTYAFLDKDSMVQCEEIRAVSKSRLDAVRGCIGTLTPDDFELVKGKFRRAYGL